MPFEEKDPADRMLTMLQAILEKQDLQMQHQHALSSKLDDRSAAMPSEKTQFAKVVQEETKMKSCVASHTSLKSHVASLMAESIQMSIDVIHMSIHKMHISIDTENSQIQSILLNIIMYI